MRRYPFDIPMFDDEDSLSTGSAPKSAIRRRRSRRQVCPTAATTTTPPSSSAWPVTSAWSDPRRGLELPPPEALLRMSFCPGIVLH